MENLEACIEDELWRTDDSEMALSELRGRLTTLRQQLDLILRAELGSPQAEVACKSIEVLTGDAEEQQPQRPFGRSLLEQQAGALQPTRGENDGEKQLVMPTSLPSQRVSCGDTFPRDLGHDRIVNIVHSRLKQDFNERLENMDTKMRWLSQSMVEALRGVETLRTEISPTRVMNKETHENDHSQPGVAQTGHVQSLNSSLNGVREFSIPNLQEMRLSLGKDGLQSMCKNDFHLRGGSMQTPDMGNGKVPQRIPTPSLESFDAVQFLKKVDQKHTELRGLIQAESGARADLRTEVCGLKEKVDQVSLYQDNMLKIIEQLADKLGHLHTSVDEVRGVGNSFENSPVDQREERVAHFAEISEGNYQACREMCESMISEAERSRKTSLQDFQKEITAHFHQLCKNVGDEVILSTNKNLQEVQTQLNKRITAKFSSEMQSSFRQRVNTDTPNGDLFTTLTAEVERLWAVLYECVPEVSGKLGDVKVVKDPNLDMTMSTESITGLASHLRSFDSNTEVGLRNAGPQQDVTKARAQSFFNIIAKSFRRSLTRGMFEEVVGDWVYECYVGKKTFTIARDQNEDLIFRQPIICEIENCCFEGILFPKNIDDVRWVCARLRDSKDNLIAGSVQLRYDEKVGGLSILLRGLLRVDVETIALPRVQVEAPAKALRPMEVDDLQSVAGGVAQPQDSIHGPQENGKTDELFELKKVRACKMFNLVSKALDTEEAAWCHTIKSVESTPSPRSIPEPDNDGVNESKDDSRAVCKEYDFSDDEFCVMKETSQKMFNLVLKCQQGNAMAQAREARKKNHADHARCFCNFCCWTPSGNECNHQLQNSGLPQQDGPLEIGTVPMGSDGVDAACLQLNRSMFELVSRSLSAKARESDSSSRENKPPQLNEASNMLRLVKKAIGSDFSAGSHGSPVKISNALCVVNAKARDSEEVMGEEEFVALKQRNARMFAIVAKAFEGSCEKSRNTSLQLYEETTHKLLRLVKKVTGSDVNPERVHVKQNNVGSSGKVMTETEYQALRQLSEQMLTLVMKAREDLHEEGADAREDLQEERADTVLGLKETTEKLLRLIKKVTGSDVNPDRVHVKQNNVGSSGRVMTETEYLALRQKSEQMLTIVMKAREDLHEERADAREELNEERADTLLGLNKENVCKMMRLVKKITGSDLSADLDQAASNGRDIGEVMREEHLSVAMNADAPLEVNNQSTCKMRSSDLSADLDRSLMKANNASCVVEAKMGKPGDAVGDEEFLALRQKSECLLTMVKKSSDTLRDRPPVAVATNTAGFSRWWMMCITFCSGREQSAPRKTSTDDVVELEGPVGLVEEVSNKTVCDGDSEQ